MATLLKVLTPTVGGFCIGWVTRQRLLDAANTSIRKEVICAASESGKVDISALSPTTGSWCECSSLAVVNRLFVAGDSLRDFARKLKRLAASRVETPGFKSISAFTRPLVASETQTVEPGGNSTPQSKVADNPLPEGAEVLVIEEWLDPLAAAKLLDVPKEWKKEEQVEDMRGSLWVCVAPPRL